MAFLKSLPRSLTTQVNKFQVTQEVVTTPLQNNPHRSSFRDPAGYIFESGGRLYRAVHPSAKSDIDALFESGLYRELADRSLLVRHERMADAQCKELGLEDGWMALRVVDRLPVISYSCEWTDGQLRAAALLTIEIQKRALLHGLCLKDATSFNVQFIGATPIFIDILSFTTRFHADGWIAYRQFCEHFLAPLALHKYQPGTQVLSGLSIDGIGLKLASRILPSRTWLVVGIFLHIHIHSRFINKYEGHDGQALKNDLHNAKISNSFHLQLARSLQSVINGIKPRNSGSAWINYRTCNTYNEESARLKLDFVKSVINRVKPCRVLDLGANDGFYSFEVAKMGIPCTAVERDNECCEAIYGASKSTETSLLVNTIRVNIVSPTPAYGWANEERTSFLSRFACDMTLALALLHHLTITEQIPFRLIANYFARLSPDLIIEYIPPDDPMVIKLLHGKANVSDILLSQISHASFLQEFGRLFHFREQGSGLGQAGRIMYHLKRRGQVGTW